MASWQDLVLDGIGAPKSPTNLQALTAWMQSEGMPPEAHNPLAVSDRSFTYVMRPPYAQPFYPSQGVGVAATLRTLKGSVGGYGPIREAFKRDAGFYAIWAAVNASQWCATCQDGHYPVVLWRKAMSLPGGQSTLSPPHPSTAVPMPGDSDHRADYHQTIKVAAKNHASAASHIEGHANAIRGMLRSRIRT